MLPLLGARQPDVGRTGQGTTEIATGGPSPDENVAHFAGAITQQLSADISALFLSLAKGNLNISIWEGAVTTAARRKADRERKKAERDAHKAAGVPDSVVLDRAIVDGKRAADAVQGR
ncbi:hypothetical protein [Microvirga sp. VF16]|uniref:hypothetical protein n=1 Tax=Microvirga sp. VF16 TaxID=2807101 RepID=UPI00193CD139|nr:hypothetical protein [Microvirga sp. VF16]QRM32229.1 hypothetical protein JO965_29265 [Microvirga sp. VF16]